MTTYLDCFFCVLSLRVPVRVVFSWTQFNDATEYHFQLALDPAMLPCPFEERIMTTTYDGTLLEHSQNYFWRVRATKPAPSDWGPVRSFTTESPPPPPAPTSLSKLDYRISQCIIC